MPIRIPDRLPAKEILKKENINVMGRKRAEKQDIRPLKMIILNLMPTKIETETQLLRLIGNSPLQVEIGLLQTGSYTSKHTPKEHLLAFYKTFADVKEEYFDALIITGAPVEMMPFEEVLYWQELREIMEWTKKHVYSTLYICWGAQAGLHYHFGIPKYPLDNKMFGVFAHEIQKVGHPLLRGFDDVFMAPHSRHTEVRTADLAAIDELDLLAVSPVAGVHLAASKNLRMVFATGHAEYDAGTLAKEYFRDVNQNLPIQIPVNYFPGDNPDNPPKNIWRAHATLFFSNWIDTVYQGTPYDLKEIEQL